MLLALDTATQMIGLALHTGDDLIAELAWRAPQRHTVELAPAVADLLTREGVGRDQLTALAVATGPGSYSGLRIGVAFAKAMASALRLPLVGVSTLDSAAAGTPQVSGGLIVIVSAGRRRIVAAPYQWRRGRWKQRSAPENMDWETLIANVDGPAYLTGEISAEGRAALAAAVERGVPVTVAPPALRLRRAGFLAETALLQLAEQPGTYSPAQVVPVYVKTKDSP
ncbi:MAG: tRNA (adenosine(37)-N6)-threonylcarbamoyltransferase complex dimerization subunit type 1 TsaB [Chloroflexi bacterium]|nr:tRNA (adenosine(37)-N6)-threonylcarbamoyltransferase complex dimerization subunit type 1 TsaB [Chloroflexota bacterium]